MTEIEIMEEKLKIANDLLCEAVLFDILHMRTQIAYKEYGIEIQDAVNSMQHNTYKEIVSELKKRYQNKLDKLKGDDNR